MGICVSTRTTSQVARMAAEKFNVVFVLGGPGAGKGTQCANIVKEYGYVHLSAGDLLRAERQREGSTYGALIQQHIKNGTIVPVEITCALLRQAMEDSNKQKFLIDGFPRNEDNREGWEKEMSDRVNIQFVLFFDCDEQVCIDRCLKRGQTSGRADDNEESLKKRIHTYQSNTMPIIEHYSKLDLVKKVNAALDENQVFDEVKKCFT